MMTDSIIQPAAYQWVTDTTAAMKAYGDIRYWDVSRVTNMDNLFGSGNPQNWYWTWDWYNGRYQAQHISVWNQNFNADLSQWDTSRVTSMVSMFNSASSFNSNLSTWDISQVTSLYAMFYAATAFNSDLSAWNTDKVTTMYAMFYSASAFNSYLSLWNISQVTTLNAMFTSASAFNQTLCWDVSKVIFDIKSADSFDNMFTGSNGSLDSSCLFPHYPMTDDQIQVAAYQWATKNWFAKAKYGNIWNWDTSRVTNMDNLFGSGNPQNWYWDWSGVTIRLNISVGGMRTSTIIYPIGIPVVLHPWCPCLKLHCLSTWTYRHGILAK